MTIFQSPPSTRYDLNFTLAGIRVRVHPLFWLMVLLFGASSDLLHLVVWVVVVFISIVVHELGHALAMAIYGQNSHIVLYLWGGLTVPEYVRWGSSRANVTPGPNQQIFISFAGPLAGFLLAGLVMLGVVAMGGSVTFTPLFGLIPLPSAQIPFGGRFVYSLVSAFIWINIFWGLINLMPVYPLDGGNISRHIFLKVDPMNGVRKSLWVSVIAGGIVATMGLLLFHSIFMVLLFGYLAYQSYQTLQGRAGFRF